MTVNKRSKISRQRGSFTHGWGAKKKHRGAGHRGGRGNAGSGKRGDAKNPTYNKIKRYFIQYGFTSKSRALNLAINVGYIEAHLDAFIANGKVVEEKGVYKIDCNAFGVSKLLSKGTVTKKFEITVEAATEKAVAKVEAAGGKVVSGFPSEDVNEE